MADNSDLSRLLPDPPPPRPARRDAALAAAMRRFDGIPDPVAEAAPRPAASRGGAGKRWGPVGAFASILVVALISVPIALHTPGGPVAPEPHTETAPRAGPAAPAPAPAPATQASAVPAKAAAGREDVPQLAAGGSTPAPAQLAEAEKPGAGAPVVAGFVAPEAAAPQAKMAAAAPLPEPPPSAADSDIVVTAQRAAMPSFQSASPVTVISQEDIAAEDRNIVVTGSRIARSRTRIVDGRGDWNACTVDDPAHSLRGCKQLIDPGAKGPSGAAAARVADGLALAWRGDWNEAIASFDQAIALRPGLAIAWLNRGLAYRSQGDLTHAAADLDQAVRYGGDAARNHYHRSLLWRQLGNIRGAQADAKRAIDLDPAYSAILD
jgi:hypothetical protein